MPLILPLKGAACDVTMRRSGTRVAAFAQRDNVNTGQRFAQFTQMLILELASHVHNVH